MIYGLLLMSLALYKATTLWKAQPGMNTTRLIKVLVRDQVIYFLAYVFLPKKCSAGSVNPVMLSVILISALEIMEKFNAGSSALFAHILVVLTNPPLLSVLGARLLFNMKEAGAKGLNEGTSCGSKSTISDIEFGAPPEAVASQSQDDAMEARTLEIEEIC